MASSGRTCQARISSRHSSVIFEMVSCEISMPIVRWQCRAISRTLIPPAYKLITVSLIPAVRRTPFGISAGSNVPARSRGTLMLTGPASLLSVPARQRPPLTRPRPGHQLPGQVRHHLLRQHQPAVPRTLLRRRQLLRREHLPAVVELSASRVYRCHLDLPPSRSPP